MIWTKILSEINLSDYTDEDIEQLCKFAIEENINILIEELMGRPQLKSIVGLMTKEEKHECVLRGIPDWQIAYTFFEYDKIDLPEFFTYMARFACSYGQCADMWATATKGQRNSYDILRRMVDWFKYRTPDEFESMFTKQPMDYCKEEFGLVSFPDERLNCTYCYSDDIKFDQRGNCMCSTCGLIKARKFEYRERLYHQ